MDPIELRLLPDTALIEPVGELSIGGCLVSSLAAQFGTPLFIYDEQHIRNRCREASESFGAGNVVYATKAFLCTEMAKLVHEEGLMLDVATGGELFVALSAGVPANRCVLHGNNKSSDELHYAIREGVHHIVVDSFDELERLEHVAGFLGAQVNVQIRVTPGVHAHTHEFVSTGQDDSKFGFNMGNGDAMRAVDTVRRSSRLNLIGLHFHIGSNVLDIEHLGKAIDVMVSFFAPLGLSDLTVGGGLGVAYVASEHAPTMEQWGTVVRRATASLPKDVVVRVEPGRSIVASSAITVYTVGTQKDIPGVRSYVAVDGGMSDNPRPMMYGSGYEAFMPTLPSALRPRNVRVVGKHCESGDIVIEEAQVPAELEVGSLLATPVTGAYGYSMASNYNMVTKPAVVFVKDGHARVVRRRETYEDLLTLNPS
ncbi:MAG: diaminopimelate decarboxylase [Actinomycetota bacterium]|jgi:diaminopimelate decarboxylase